MIQIKFGQRSIRSKSAQFQKNGACVLFFPQAWPKKRRGIYLGIVGLCKSFFYCGGFTKPYVTKNCKSGTCAVLLKLGWNYNKKKSKMANQIYYIWLITLAFYLWIIFCKRNLKNIAFIIYNINSKYLRFYAGKKISEINFLVVKMQIWFFVLWKCFFVVH